MAYGKIKADAVIWDNSGSDVEESMSNIAGKLNAAGGAMTGNLTLNAQNELRLADSDSSNYIALASAATVGTNSTWTLPADAPVAGDALKVTSVSSNNPTLEWGTITTKIVGCTVFQNNTQFVPASSSNNSFVQWFTFNYNKQQSGTELWVWGTTQGYGPSSGHRNNDNGKPISIVHPNSTDHGGFPTPDNGGSGTTIYVFEVDV